MFIVIVIDYCKYLIKNDLSQILKDPWRYAVDHVRIHYRGTYMHQRLPVTSQKARELPTSKRTASHVSPGTLLHHMFTKSSALPDLLKTEHIRHVNMIKSTQAYTSAVPGVLENTSGPMSEQQGDDMIDGVGGGIDNNSPHHNALDATYNSSKQSKYKKDSGNNGKSSINNKKTGGANQRFTHPRHPDHQLAKITNTPIEPPGTTATTNGKLQLCMSEGAAEAAYDDLCYWRRLDKFECELQECLTAFVKEYEAALDELKTQQQQQSLLSSIADNHHHPFGRGRGRGRGQQRRQRQRRRRQRQRRPAASTLAQKRRKRNSTYYDYIGHVSNTSSSCIDDDDDDDDFSTTDNDDDRSSIITTTTVASSCADVDDDDDDDNDYADTTNEQQQLVR